MISRLLGYIYVGTYMITLPFYFFPFFYSLLQRVPLKKSLLSEQKRISIVRMGREIKKEKGFSAMRYHSAGLHG